MYYRSLSAAVLILFMMSGCVPKVDKATPIATTVINADLEKNIALFGDKTLETDWWKRYGDTQLDEIIEKALSNAPSLQSIEARYAQANSIIQSIQSYELPHLSASASVLRERFSANHIFPAPLGGGTFTQYQPGLVLDYDFDFWNERKSRILAAKNNAMAEKAYIEASKLALASAICETYLSWHYDERRIELLEDLDKTTQEELRIVEKQYKLGLIDAVAVYEKKAAQSQIIQRIDELHRSIEGKKESIGILGGFLPSYVGAMKAPHIREGLEPLLPKEIVLNLLAHRPDVAMAKYTALSKSHTIEQAKAQFYPNISLSGFLGFTSFNWSRLFDRSSYSPYVGIAASLPLLDWGAREANLQNRVSDYNSSVYEYNQAVIKAANEVVVLLKQNDLLHVQKVSHTEEISVKQKNADIARRKYLQGLSNKLPYLGEHKTVLESQMGSLMLEETGSLIRVNLIRSLGGGYTDKEEDNATL